MWKYIVLACALALAACGGSPLDNRTRLAQTEISAAAAYKEVTALATAGVIRRGSGTAVVIADAELALAAAIRVWRTDPENPKYAEAAVAALPALLQLISRAKAPRTSWSWPGFAPVPA